MIRHQLLIIFGIMLALQGTLPARSAKKIVLKNLSGVSIAPLDGKDRKATVLFFITNDCPIANSYAPEIERISKTYSPKRIAFYLVYVDGSLSVIQANKHHREYGYSMPALLDPAHKLVKLSYATVTPETAIFAPDGRLLYHGRIDDRAVDFGKVRAMSLKRDLREDLDALLSGKPISATSTKAVGCYIADLPQKQ
jgi:thiol-disulfide isomerase/thioredoxin